MEDITVGQSILDLDTPVLLLDLDLFEKNVKRMADYCAAAGVSWRPHAKGQKVPALVHKEIAAGAIGCTVAKLGEAEVMAAAGITDILIANEIVGRPKALRLAALTRHADVTCLVDSTAALADLNAAAEEFGTTIPVLVEINVGMDRCGVEPGQPVVELARRVSAYPHLRFRGVQTWEAHTIGIKDPLEKETAVATSIKKLTDSAELCRQAGLDVEIVSCGGSADYYYSAKQPGITEIEAGGAVFMDIFYETRGVKHDFAMTVMSSVVSRSATNRIVTDAGKKTMSWQEAVPRPKSLTGVKAVKLSAEHGAIELDEPNDRVRVGDRVEWIIGYSDTTTCLHNELIAHRGGRVEAIWPILGRGKLR